MYALNDDPMRVAAPYCAPGEVEPEIISDTAATDTVIDAIERHDSIYGKPATELRDWIIDAILNDAGAQLEMIRRCRDLTVVERACGEIANESEDV